MDPLPKSVPKIGNKRCKQCSDKANTAKRRTRLTDMSEVTSITRKARLPKTFAAQRSETDQTRFFHSGGEDNPNKSPMENNINTDDSVHLSMVRHHLETIGSPRAAGTDP